MSAQPNDSPPRRLSYVLAITNRCNFECPLCYASITRKGCLDMPMEHIRTLALRVKADGGQRLSLSGGEPTLHPNILEIVRMIRHDVGLLPVIMSNGLRIAEDRSFASSLKDAGLSRVHLQFDTLRSDTYRRLRGREDVTEKTRAIQNILDASLRFGLIVTVCSQNLDETGELLDYALALVPHLRTIRFQTAVPVGRFPSKVNCVTKQNICDSLAKSTVQCQLHVSDFGPTQSRDCVLGCCHQDCAVHLLIRVEAGKGIPSWRHKTLGSPRTSNATGACRHALRKDTRGASHHMIASIVSFMRPETRDSERIQQCVAMSVTEHGFISICERACTGATTPFSRDYETASNRQ